MSDLLNITGRIAAAYVGANPVAREELPDLIGEIHAALDALANPDAVVDERPAPAVPIAESLTDAFIYCLEDGLPFKSLKRHLRTKYDLTPDDYRARWGLPADYPMVAPAYARERSALAKRSGLGRKKT